MMISDSSKAMDACRALGALELQIVDEVSSVLWAPDAALQAVGRAHRDGTHHPVADLLLHFEASDRSRP